LTTRPIDPNAREALKEMKLETANELGLKFDTESDKGNLTSRTNGHFGGDLGGVMVRKLIEMGERELMDKLK